MNITHAKEEVIVGDFMEAIFARQSELMEKYHHIEAKSGLMQTEDCPVNINDKRGQARLKDFAWRITEELGEALDTYYEHNSTNDNLHFQEELVDALHFFTEFTILTGITPCDIVGEIPEDKDYLETIFNLVPQPFSVEHAVSQFIRQLAMTCNTLKNKPWKQTQMITDKREFKFRLVSAWLTYVGVLKASGLDAEKTTALYLKKSQVNKFRQRTNY
ncbi:MAG: dUTP diphosphatase [Fusobacteriaceae bacterium]